MKTGWKQRVRKVFKCDSLRGQNCRIEEELGLCPEGRKICCYFCPKRCSCYATCSKVVGFLKLVDNIGEMEC